jgi:hypothetical protein
LPSGDSKGFGFSGEPASIVRTATTTAKCGPNDLRNREVALGVPTGGPIRRSFIARVVANSMV